ncbi:hypothetical protein [Verticiella sediminum]
MKGWFMTLLRPRGGSA